MNWLFCGKLKFCFTKILFYYCRGAQNKYPTFFSFFSPKNETKGEEIDGNESLGEIEL